LSYKITFKKSVSRDLKKISKGQAKKILDRIEKQLSKKADEYPELKGNFAGLRRCRVGDYRIIFSIIDDTVLITRIGHRRKVYK